MKVIGLIGGMSWNSSAEYYRIINELIVKRQGGLHSARLILYSLDFSEVEQVQREGHWDNAATILGEAGRALKLAGADFLIVCTNTMHKVADAVAQSSGLPLLHICDVTGKAIAKSGLRSVGLLGTLFITEEPFFQRKLQEHFGGEVLVPNEKDRAVIHRIIYDELCQGKFKASSRRACVKIISRLIERGAEGIILGCTELPLLIQPGDVNVPLFDTTRLHAEATVDLAFAEG